MHNYRLSQKTSLLESFFLYFPSGRNGKPRPKWRSWKARCSGNKSICSILRHNYKEIVSHIERRHVAPLNGFPENILIQINVDRFDENFLFRMNE